MHAAALFFALVLWFVVSATEPSEQLIPVRFNPLSRLTLGPYGRWIVFAH